MVALYSLQAEGEGTAMTTETESLEALHLWLATELPELRSPLGFHLHPDVQTNDLSGTARNMSCEEAGCPGWQPNVSTDALLEALRDTCDEVRFRVKRSEGTYRARLCRLIDTLDGPDAAPYPVVIAQADGETAHEALCRAARKALEAAS